MSAALLMHGGALGDFVLSLTIVHALRRRGADHVAVLGRAPADVALRCGTIDAHFDLDHGGWHALFAADAEIAPDLRRRLGAFHTIVDMIGGSNGAVAAQLRRATSATIACIDPRPRPDWRGHITEQWLADLSALDLGEAPLRPTIIVPPADRAMARRRLFHASVERHERQRSACNKIALIHPGSGSREKCWPIDRFTSLGERLESIGFVPAFLLGPVEQERFDAEIRRDLACRWPVHQPIDSFELAALLAAADLYVGNDSGVSHLAAAAGVPVVAVFGPTDPRLWRPLGTRVHAVRDDAESGDPWPSVDRVLDSTLSLVSARA